MKLKLSGLLISFALKTSLNLNLSSSHWRQRKTQEKPVQTAGWHFQAWGRSGLPLPQNFREWGNFPKQRRFKAHGSGLITWEDQQNAGMGREGEEGDPGEGVPKRLSCHLPLRYWSTISTSRAVLSSTLSQTNASSGETWWFLTRIFDAWTTIRILLSSQKTAHNSQNSPYHYRGLMAPLKFFRGPSRSLWISIRCWHMWPRCAVLFFFF